MDSHYLLENVRLLMNNGFASNYFGIAQDVMQGDLLSPLLFILRLVVLGYVLTQNEDIQFKKSKLERKR